MPGSYFDVRLVVERDFRRDALNYFHIVAGGVLRRQQTERRPASGLDAVHMARIYSTERVDFDIDGL
jgi:hypothetical protein